MSSVLSLFGLAECLEYNQDLVKGGTQENDLEAGFYNITRVFELVTLEIQVSIQVIRGA